MKNEKIKTDDCEKCGYQSQIMKFFTYEHLPEKLQETSAPFCILAEVVEEGLPPGAEKNVCLRKLLEAKDAAVRAAT